EAGFHQTGTSGAFGATAAAGRMLRLDPARMAQALCLTATRAAGLKSQFGTMGKPLNAGFAAEVGVTSALLAQAGATSAPDAIEGAQGFGPTHAGSADVSALDGLGDAWVFPNISYKFHACCHGLHAMLEALREIRDEGLNAAEIESVTVRTHPRWLAVCNQPEPTTGLQAKFSYRLTAAMMLSGVDTAALDSYTDATCARSDLRALRDRVRVETDDGLSDSAAEVSVVASGQTHSTRHDILTPIDPALIERRLRDKSATLLGGAEAEALWRSVARIDEAEGVARLMACLGARPGQTLAEDG
ncbi:MmgE/PrpD family protein, partial [Limimaricola sp. ASW11-118]